jgi:UDP-3-O-[3-hydroxymyristoyl] glucosamine N-acyltransferase
MSESNFFPRDKTPTIAEIIAWTGAKPPGSGVVNTIITGVAPLDLAGSGDLAFLDNPKYAPALTATRASACLVSARHAALAPVGVVALVTPEPYRAFATVLARLYPSSARPGSTFGSTGVSPGATVHPEARLEAGVIVDPGAVIGPRAVIGAGTTIGANAVIGADVCIGRDTSIGAHATVLNAVVGDRVILHSGVRIGQDGFGFAMGPRGHMKVPQIGRVLIQNDVEIGANSTVDRGAIRDTIIGEGSKIDNLVQIGHNVKLGRHCVIVSQVGISGSTELGDFVVVGGQAGFVGHLKVGSGAQIAGKAGVVRDVPPGERQGGFPAMPMREWLRRQATQRWARLGRDRGRRDGQANGGEASE